MYIKNTSNFVWTAYVNFCLVSEGRNNWIDSKNKGLLSSKSDWIHPFVFSHCLSGISNSVLPLVIVPPLVASPDINNCVRSMVPRGSFAGQEKIDKTQPTSGWASLIGRRETEHIWTISNLDQDGRRHYWLRLLTGWMGDIPKITPHLPLARASSSPIRE